MKWIALLAIGLSPLTDRGLDSHGARLQAPEFDPARSRAELEKVLSRYAAEEATRMRADPSEALARWIERRLEDLLMALEAMRRRDPGLYWLMVGGCIVVLFLILGHGYFILKKALHGPSETSPAETPKAPDLEELRRKALQAEREGRYAEALTHLFGALLLWLGRKGSIRYRQATTNWEYAREVAKDSRAAAPFRRLVDAFEPVAYGGVPCDSSRYEKARAEVSLIAGNEI